MVVQIRQYRGIRDSGPALRGDTRPLDLDIDTGHKHRTWIDADTDTNIDKDTDTDTLTGPAKL